MENALISICIPTYNGEKYLQEALDSVTKQTYKNIEVIISDDASADATLEIAENFKQQAPFPVSIFKHDPAGIGANWDHCIEKATGEWIKFLFQDDILEPNCLEEFLKVQQKTGEQVFFCKRIIIDSIGKDISDTSYIADLQKRILPDLADYMVFSKKDLKLIGKKKALSHNFIGEPVAGFVSKSAYLKTGLHNPKLRQLLDLEYNLRLLRNFKIVLINQKLVRFRVHPEQTTQQNRRKNINEHLILDHYIIRNFYKYLSRAAILGYFYERFGLLKNLRGKIPF